MIKSVGYKRSQLDGDLSLGRDLEIGGNLTTQGNGHVKGDLRVDGWLNAPNVLGAFKGYFRTDAALKAEFPHGRNGWWALVGETLPAAIWRVENRVWVNTGNTGGTDFIGDAVVKALIDDLTRQLQAERERVDKLNDGLTRELQAERERVDALEQWCLTADKDLELLKRGAVVMGSSRLPITHTFHEADPLTWDGTTQAETIRAYFAREDGLWAELLEAADGRTNRGIYLLSDDSWERTTFVPGEGALQKEVVPATKVVKLRLTPVSVADDVNGESMLFSYVVSDEGGEHDWFMRLYRSKDDAVYSCKRWMRASGGGVPGDWAKRLEALEGLLMM